MALTTLHYLNLFTKTYHRLTIHNTNTFISYIFRKIKTFNSQAHCRLKPTIFAADFFLLPLSTFPSSAAHENRNGLVVLSSILYLIHYGAYPDHTDHTVQLFSSLSHHVLLLLYLKPPFYTIRVLPFCPQFFYYTFDQISHLLHYGFFNLFLLRLTL